MYTQLTMYSVRSQHWIHGILQQDTDRIHRRRCRCAVFIGCAHWYLSGRAWVFVGLCAFPIIIWFHPVWIYVCRMRVRSFRNDSNNRNRRDTIKQGPGKCLSSKLPKSSLVTHETKKTDLNSLFMLIMRIKSNCRCLRFCTFDDPKNNPFENFAV